MTDLGDRTARGRVDGFTHGGEGVVRVDGKAVFVPGTIPGEQVEVEVVEDHPRWARARLLAVLEPADERVEPPCPHAEVCGGCDLQHVEPAAQRRLKERVVREQLARLGRLPDAPVAPCLPVGPDLGYRTHAQLHADHDGRLGYHRAGTHEVVPIGVCPILTPAAQQLREAIGDGTGAAHVTVRAQGTGTRAARITPGPGPLELPEADASVTLVQPDGSGVTVRGDDELEEVVDGLTFRFDSSSFFQVSPGGAAAIVEQVLAAVGEVSGRLVWDLYAGVGLLSLPLARAGAEVVCVEGHAPAARFAEANAAAAGLEVAVERAPVQELVAAVARGRRRDLDAPEVVVLDPPRAGAGRRLLGDLASLRPPTVVYVACDVASLARDARELTERHGYALTSVQPLDLFPMTHHVETVATFRR